MSPWGAASVSELVDHYHLDAQIHDDHTLLYFPVLNRRNVKRQEKWIRKKTLGQGSYGVVWLEQNTDSEMKEVRAVKILRKDIGHNFSFGTDYAHELYAIARLSRNPDHFPQFYGWYESTTQVFFSMEYFPLGDLASCIRGPLPEAEVHCIARQLLTGLQIMHKDSITHRDLNLQNIFVVEQSPDWWVKIGDFGISKRIQSESTYLHTYAGTEAFMAPEILEEDNMDGYCNAVDMWALGCVLFCLFTCSKPFKDKRSIRKYASGQIVFPAQVLQAKDITPAAFDFLVSLLSSRPENRPSANNALQLPWVNMDQTHVVASGQDAIRSTEPAPYVLSESMLNEQMRTIEIVDHTVRLQQPRQSRALSNSTSGLAASMVDVASDTVISLPNQDRWEDLFSRGRNLAIQAEYTEAEKVLRKAVDIQQKMLGLEHKETANVQHWLGQTLYTQQKYEEAEQILRKTLEIRRKVLGLEHEHTANTQHWLGVALYKQQKYKEAERMLHQSFEVQRKLLGVEHELTANTQNWLGITLYKQQKYKEAERMLHQTHETRRKILGREHESTACAQHWLGVNLYKQQKYSEAERTLRHNLEFRQKTSGLEHEETANTQYWLGRTLYDQQKYKEAERALSQAFNIQAKIFGQDHEETADTKSWLLKAANPQTSKTSTGLGFWSKIAKS